MLATLPALPKRQAVERAWQVRLLRSYEMGLEAHVAHVFAQAGRRAAILYRQNPRAELVDMLAGSLARVIRPSLVATARAFAERIAQMHAPKSEAFSPRVEKDRFERKAFEDLDVAIVDFMDDHTAELVVGVSDTTREAIANAIRAGTEQGLSVEDIAQLIVDTTSGEIGIARARRIARTETHAAAMYGQQIAAENSPLDYTKTWLATEDARTRFDHAEANGQTVALAEAFDVGGEALRYPGDLEGSAWNVINCRCVCLYDPVQRPMRPGPEGYDIPYTQPDIGGADETPERE